MNVPADLRYSTDHEWVRREGNLVTIGITEFAQDSLGDIVFVEAPETGTALAAGDSFTEVESTKSVSDIYAPVSGSIVAINDSLDGAAGAAEQRSVRRRVDLHDRDVRSERVRRPARRRRLPRPHRGLTTRRMSEYVYCNQCGHRNPPTSAFCSSCGSPLDSLDDRTVTLTVVDPLQNAPGTDDDVVVPVGELPTEIGVLIVRAGAQAGDRFQLSDLVTRLGRHPDSEISLDDITVSRRHAEIERTPDGYIVSDAGSLNGTYVNQERIDKMMLQHGDELQIGKFRLVFFERNDA